MDSTETDFQPTGFMVIDTETSALPDWKKDADHPDQPRVAEFAAILLDRDGIVEREFQRYVRPEGWTMHPDASAINGLTDDFLLAQGTPIAEVLDWYTSNILAGRAVVAYGAQFDCKLMRGELRRSGRDDLFERTHNTCLMRSARPFAKQIGRELVKAGGSNKGWPKLDDLCAFLGIERTEKHGGMVDVRDTTLCFQKMLIRGFEPRPSVHYAKPENLEAIRSNR